MSKAPARKTAAPKARTGGKLTGHQVFVSDLKSNTRAAMIDLLNARLADTIDLKLAVKQAHWNIKGPSFIAIHELLDQVSARVEEHYDTIAERCVQLGGTAFGTVQAVAKATSLSPYPTAATSQTTHVRQIADHLGAVAAACRAAVDQADEAGDAITADIFTGIARALDKDHWFIGAHLG
ncbi:MAG: DNA starvation/stationary phase protection protein Dps [Proteobacteria bacterium]|nr:DNA starvation/stationary phase protection protein Dps [Pseudomonadota bacterium]